MPNRGMLTEQQIKAVLIMSECGFDEYEIVDKFDDEGVPIFLGEVRLIFAGEKYEQTRTLCQ